MHVVTLKGTGHIEEWRQAARSLVRRAVPPEAIEWRTAAADGELFAGTLALPHDGSEETSGPAVPPAFIAYAEAVVCHSDPGRFALLYRLLWRLRSDRAAWRHSPIWPVPLSVTTCITRAATAPAGARTLTGGPADPPAAAATSRPRR